MAWTVSGYGTLHGITGVIAGITGPVADAAQITAVKTLLLSEVAGITLYNGAKLNANGDTTGARTFQFNLVGVTIDLGA